MGSGASSASPLRAAIAETSEEDLKAALNAMKPEDLARFSNMVEEAGKAAEAAPKAPTFEKAPMEVPGISREEALPKRSIVSIAPPAGRPRSAEMKKKVAPASAIASEIKQETTPETSKVDVAVAVPEEEGKPATDKGQQEVAATKIQAIQRGKVARRSVSQAGEDKKEDAVKAEEVPTVTKDEVKTDADKGKQEVAATKIQAIQRGKVARRSVSQAGEDKKEDAPKAEEAPKTDAEKTIASKLENKVEEPAMAEHIEVMAEK